MKRYLLLFIVLCLAFSVFVPVMADEGKTYVIRVACDKESPRADNVFRAADRLTEQLKAEGSTDVVTAEYILVPDDFENNMAMWDKTGDLPEMLVGNGSKIAKFAVNGFLIDVSDIVEGEVYSAKVEKNVRDMGLVNGTLYGVIQDMEVRPVWIFKPHLVSLGWSEEDIAALPGKVERGEFTQADLQALAKEAVDKGLCQYGIFHRPSNGAEFRNLHIIQGGDGFYPYRDGKVVSNRQTLLDFFGYLRQNVELGLTPADMTTVSWDAIEGDIWPNGKTFCWYGGIWNKDDIMKAANVSSDYIDENYVLILPPVKDAGNTPVTLSNPQFYGLTKQVAVDPQMHEYCKRVLEIILDPDIQMNTTIASSHLAITKETEEYPEYRDNTFLSRESYMLKYAFVLPGDVNVTDGYYAGEFYSAIQAAEMTTDPIEDIVDYYLETVTYAIGAENIIFE